MRRGRKTRVTAKLEGHGAKDSTTTKRKSTTIMHAARDQEKEKDALGILTTSVLLVDIALLRVNTLQGSLLRFISQEFRPWDEVNGLEFVDVPTPPRLYIIRRVLRVSLEPE